ncbi:uncharacterized protein LOC496105 precursor [Xenopus laevis]|uniref:LOC496105 protein n=2 Tax=Xenopus laevis TaxID=8355 RepID=Q5PPL9_XENLA|nr:uncharacterized protein LOC496105 precursor [Xenopus laevis]AAH87618.1 LOC496105 protein [Xenopus laevis]OCT91250.1 hypothetical protein XELAEV_18014301mg [Xenopus laevis]
MAGLCLLLLICHLSSSVLAVLRSPENVTIHSANFQHILTWKDNNNNSLIRYRVQYNKWSFPFRRRWTHVSTCTDITEQRCDLTDYFTDLKGEYNVQVISFTPNETSNATTSATFCPKCHTDLGPPLVDLSAQGCNVTINIRPPISYFNGTHSMLHNDIYPLITYGIDRWQDNNKLSYHEQMVYEDNYTLVESLLPPNTNYCVSVKVSLVSSNTKGKKIPSALQCVTTSSTQAEDFHPPYISIAVIISILIPIGIVCLLIGLDRAGYICMGWNLFPKALNSFPTSVSMDGRTEYVCPAQIVSVETLCNTEMEECNVSYEEMCGQGYAVRNMVLDTAQNDSSGGESSAIPPLTFSSSIESSGQDCSFSAEEGIPKEPVLEHTQSGASASELPQAVTSSPGPTKVNTTKVFKISLNTVSVGNPEDLWTNFKKEASPIEKQEDITAVDVSDVPQDPHDLRLITNILKLGACRGSVLEEASDDSDAESEAEETEMPFASDYMSR